MTTNKTFTTTKLGLAALAVLLTTATHGQLKQVAYQVTLVGPANSHYLPAMGVDTLGRVAGFRIYDETGAENPRGWLYDMVHGYRMVLPETSKVNGMSANGHLVGANYGSPTFFDWQGNATTVFTVAGEFLAVNRFGEAAGFIYDPLNNWIQTAVYFDRNGTLIQIPSLDMTNSAAYGVNDQGLVVGVAGNALGEARAFVWNGDTTFLPGLPGHTDVATAVNNIGDVIGYTVTPTDGVLPVRWIAANRSAQIQMPLPLGMDNGMARAVNDKGMVVGTMWSSTGEETRAFVTRPDGTLVDLNNLKDANARLIHLLTADAVNAGGVIVGTAMTRIHVNGPAYTMGYIARPLPMTGGIRVK